VKILRGAGNQDTAITQKVLLPSVPQNCIFSCHTTNFTLFEHPV